MSTRKNKNRKAHGRSISQVAQPQSKQRRESLDKTILILGAPGLVGAQVTRQVARELCPDTIILASLSKSDFGTLVDDIKEELKKLADRFDREDYLRIKFEEQPGNIFVHRDLALIGTDELKANPDHRRKLYEDLFGRLDRAIQNSMLAQVIGKYEPDVIIDCINTATAISYQDVDAGCKGIRKSLDQINRTVEEKNGAVPKDQYEKIEEPIELLLVSQSIPQIVRHMQILHNAMVKHKTRLYIKVGTTGTGGMGLNIPYTHGEDRPSAKLMAKSSIGFAHTGLMFLMARTPGGPIVKEIKPGAMIGYKKVVYQELRRQRKYLPKIQDLTLDLTLKLPKEDFEDLGPIKVVGVDTGENGFFARGEFEAVTSINQMEFVTPEEVARAVILEIKGSNTGHDVIAAIDGSVVPPSYRAGYLRGSAIESLLEEQEKNNPHSVATGELGPPKLTKLLYESHLLYLLAKDLDPADTPYLHVIIDQEPRGISQRMENYLEYNQDLRNTIISIGIPILLPDGETLLRGPRINVPEDAGEGTIDTWADQGWLDLRQKNIEKWQERFKNMLSSAEKIHTHGSAEITMEAYRSKEIRIGEVVGWIFNNEVKGYRIK